ADRWDRWPYQTPWGPVPPDLAARAFYLGRSHVAYAFGAKELESLSVDLAGFCVIARTRDLQDLEQLGTIEVLDVGPRGRFDRAFVAYRLERGPCCGISLTAGNSN